MNPDTPLEMDITTEHGEVPLSRLVHVYNVYMAGEKRKAEKRKEFLQTDEGKAWNRVKYKCYYDKNKEKVNEKNKARYHAKKMSETNSSAE